MPREITVSEIKEYIELFALIDLLLGQDPLQQALQDRVVEVRMLNRIRSLQWHDVTGKLAFGPWRH